MGLHQIKKLSTAKESINRVKRQLTEWEKIFARYSSDQVFTSRIYLKTEHLKSKKQTIQSINEKWNSPDTFQMVNKYTGKNVHYSSGQRSQNYIEIPQHPSLNGYHQENK
jgi:hypothetical protein